MSSARYGLISDIHANYPALEAALNYFQEARVDKILCLGDILGYGSQPDRCVQALKEKPLIECVSGNFDRDTGDLRPDDARFLKELPRLRVVDELFVMVHDSLVEKDGYMLRPQEFSQNLQAMMDKFPEQRVCFFGHTHIPLVVSIKAVTVPRATQSFLLDRKDIYLINPGFVGRPTGDPPTVSFGIFDAAKWEMTFVRQRYQHRI